MVEARRPRASAVQQPVRLPHRPHDGAERGGQGGPLGPGGPNRSCPHRVSKELAVDPSRHGEVITPPPGLRGAVVLGVAARLNVRPREPHFMRAVTALRELDMHTGANYVHTQPDMFRS